MDSSSPETVYETIDGVYLVKQEKVDWVYGPQDREELTHFMEDTAQIVEDAFEAIS